MLSCSTVSGHPLVREVDVVRVGDGSAERLVDRVAVEAPLEVRLDGRPFSVIMRTPGDDAHLAAGFLFSEGILRQPSDIRSTRVGDGVVDVALGSGLAADIDRILGGRRQVAMNSSCGVCGRRSIDDLELPAGPLPHEWTVDAAVVAGLPERLRAHQPAFAETGGLHAAALATPAGEIEVSAEDVGRHNAVDKLLGRMWLEERLPLSGSILVVSGRLSFEIVQKAWLAGVPMVVAVSAPSSLAIELAGRAAMTLVGFTRRGRFNVYAGAARIRSAA